MDNWNEGTVGHAEDEDYIVLWYEENDEPTAYIGHQGEKFIVQFVDDPAAAAKDAVIRELDFYINELQRSWAYAIYHCGTASNVYSNVHWGYHPKGGYHKGGVVCR